jgi:hypothetical protein
MISRPIYNLKIDKIGMCDIPSDRSILQLSNGIRHVMPSTDRKLELTAKASMAQPVSQPAVCSNGLSFPDFMTTAQDGGRVVSLTHRPPLLPRKYTWYSFILKADPTPEP